MSAQPPPGGLWLRAGAYLIDAVLLAFVSAVATAPLPAPLRLTVAVLLQAVYFACLPLLWNGRTLGKAAAGVMIVRDDGAPLDARAAALRVLGYAVCGLSLGLGFLPAAFTVRKRGLHDFIAGTRVVPFEPVGLARRIALTSLVLAAPLIALLLGITAALAGAPTPR